MSEQIMMGKKNVPVMLPYFDVTLDIDVIMQAAVDEVFTATCCKLHATHWNSSVVRYQRERTFFLERFNQPS